MPVLVSGTFHTFLQCQPTRTSLSDAEWIDAKTLNNTLIFRKRSKFSRKKLLIFTSLTIYHDSSVRQWQHIRYLRRRDPLRAVPRRLDAHFGPFTTLKRAITVRRAGNDRQNTWSTWPWRGPSRSLDAPRSCIAPWGWRERHNVIIIFHVRSHYRWRVHLG